jgi:glycine cleavage system regulatory protein
MTSRLILSAIGSDRPGLTQALAEAVLAAGGNWLESHLSRLGGKYVGAVLVEIDGGDLTRFEEAIRSIDATGLHVAMVPAGEEPEGEGHPLALQLVGQDRPGIVREVTSVLAGLGVNIEDFATATENGAWSGERLFRAQAKLKIPGAVTADEVQAALEAISGEIMVDFSFGPAQSA